MSRGEAHELSSYKRAVRRDYVGEGFPSAGAGYMPPRAGEPATRQQDDPGLRRLLLDTRTLVRSLRRGRKTGGRLQKMGRRMVLLSSPVGGFMPKPPKWATTRPLLNLCSHSSQKWCS
jgi:hypothetical protein